MRSLFGWRFDSSVVSIAGCAAMLTAAVACGSDCFAQNEINEAAGSGDLGKVTSLLEQNPRQVSRPDASKKTPLHWAVIGDHKTVAEVLMAFHADVNARDDEGETPLFLAAQTGKVDMVELLLTSIHTDPDRANLRGDTPLHQAVRNDDKDVAELLVAHHLDANPKPNEPHEDQTHLDAPVQPESRETVQEVLEGNAHADDKDDSGTTAVDAAASEGDGELAEVMVSRDADVNVKNNDGETPLGLAVQMEVENGDFGPDQRRDMIELLLAKGAWIDSIDNRGLTPLQQAIAADDKYLVELLLARRPNFKLDTRGGYGRTPLFVAQEFNRLDMMEFLLARGAGVDVRDESDHTPLSDAAANGRVKAAEILLAHRARVDARDGEGDTVLYWACKGAWRAGASKADQMKMMKMLLDHGADVNARDQHGATPLFAAVRGDQEIARMLIDRGADVNATAKDGKGGVTPLQIAAFWGSPETVALLLGHHALVNTKDDHGVTPLELASMLGNVPNSKLLLEYGADVNARDDSGATALHRAVNIGNRDLVELLLAHGADVNIVCLRCFAGRVEVTDATPLKLALTSDHADVAELLREHGGHE